ncbi:SGNH/GDSL hydrolase family protein [Noviherbaspirillum cavernae]|uniref:SGNH/GDSL hydrolase family protein n=1 Tax=Noviherbaspirillum cavernae TaxID=2320862 RepID=A0A418X555_9BURK|nr:SGNH/GDSL hydrolase family protein [Noviherbaspirillum cavernae]RJG07602.1 SGNH/GDSL hydrolase family protein [Noviherbaspirillum cavernae]
MRHWLPELIALPLLPFLIAQGRYTRHVTPRLPEASGPTSGITGETYGTTKPLHLLTLGESPVAGVGVGTHAEAITGQFAHALSGRLHQSVAWQALGKNGATAADALQILVPQLPQRQIDVALVAFGVNDTTAFRSVARWRDDLGHVLAALQERCTPRLILLSGVPPLQHFPALPQPLRWIMGMKARTLDAAACDLARTIPRLLHVPLALDPADPALMAVDGYHPSARGCNAWAQQLAEQCLHSGIFNEKP